MGFQATVLKIFIASPNDTSDERNQVENIIYEWNDLNSEREKIILLPIRWEKSISSEYSLTEDGQELINKRILLYSDILIMILKSKLGSPTSRAESGTLEELDVFSKENADRIGIFFCDTSAPTNSKDVIDYQKVVHFREKLQKETRGIYNVYSSKSVENFLTRQVAKFTTRLEIQKETQKSENTEKDNSPIILENIDRGTLQPDELLLLNFMYTEGYNKINTSTSFKYEVYSSFLKQNGYNHKYVDLLDNTCDKLFERNILEFLELKESVNPYNYEVEETFNYKLNIKTYDGLGKILEDHKTYVTERLQMCEVYESDLPF